MTPDGTQELTLTLAADDHWSGRGASSFPWGLNHIDDQMTIGAVAGCAGVNVETIRFYPCR